MTDYLRRMLIAIFALGALTSIIMAFSPLVHWRELAGLL
jgi:hypothetical protein